MKNLINNVLTFVLCVAVVAFALQNSAPVALGLFPFASEVVMPVYLLALILFFAGMVVGVIVSKLFNNRISKQGE